MPVRCFLLEPSSKTRRSLRRYCSDTAKKCPGPFSYHDASVLLDIVERNGPFDVGRDVPANERQMYSGWPVKCAYCSYQFVETDTYQLKTDQLFQRVDTGAEMTLHDAPPGAMWDAYWFHGSRDWCGPDGKSIVAKCPNGRDWCIDGRASNCDSRCKNCGIPYNQHKWSIDAASSSSASCKNYEDARPHKCWVRHGTPPNLTVNKAGGVTCGAGAGSIQAGDYHGFLQSGSFT